MSPLLSPVVCGCIACMNDTQHTDQAQPGHGLGKYVDGSVRVWWVPQVPGEAFHVHVSSLDEALRLVDVLADYDAFQLAHHIKPDYMNAGGIERLEDGEWSEVDVEWELEDAAHD